MNFKEWCIKHKREELLKLWDYDKNLKTPEEIGYSSNNKFYFKCERGLHDSFLKTISNLTYKDREEVTKLECKKCKSFEQWCYDNNKYDYLNLWDYNKNICLPSEVDRGSGKCFYFKCPNGKHESEKYTLNNLTNYREDVGDYVSHIVCDKCSSFGQYLLDNYGSLDIWSDKNEIDPFNIGAQSNKKVFLICEDCNIEKSVTACNFYKRKKLGCSCEDKNSYPNKFVFCFLAQLNIEFEKEKVFSWAKNKRYDFYIPSLSLIIEAHGMQHYEDVGIRNDLGKEKRNDIEKEKLAIENGIKNYIQLDCRFSNIDWIKNSLCENKVILELFKIEDINWIECGNYAVKGLTKVVCNLWNKDEYDTPQKIADLLKLSPITVRKYLKYGNDLGWCNYNPSDTMNNMERKSSSLCKKIRCKELDIEFESLAECNRFMSKKIGRGFGSTSITKVCKGEKQSHNGYTFEYVK